MKKTAIYAGSFNPWHSGHEMVVNKAFCVFDKIVVAIGQNPDKPELKSVFSELQKLLSYGINNGSIELVTFKGLLADYIQERNKTADYISANIRGMRNAQDFEYEKMQMYWNQDLKIGVPTMFFIADRDLVHVSSSAIRAIKNLKGE